MIYIKKYDTDHGSVFALCDKDLLGNIYKEGEVELDLDKYSDFYEGELVDEENAHEHFKVSEIYSANIVGERSVGVFLKLGIAGEEDIKMVQGVPFIQIFSVK